MTTPYSHLQFEVYLSSTVHSAAKDSIMRSLTLIAEHYQTEAVVNEYVDNLLYQNGEDNIHYEVIYDNITATLIELIQSNGIIINEEQLPNATIPYLNEILSGLMLLPDYEDAVSLENVLILGNSLRQRTIQMLGIVNPILINDAKYSGLLDATILEVTSNFERKLKDILSPRAEQQRAKLMIDEDVKQREQNSYCLAFGNHLANTTTILKRYPDFMVKVRPTLLWYLDNNENTDKFLRTIVYLFESITFGKQQDLLEVSNTEYAHLVAALYYIDTLSRNGDESQYLDLDYIVENLPDFAEPSHKSNLFFSGTVKKFINHIETEVKHD